MYLEEDQYKCVYSAIFEIQNIDIQAEVSFYVVKWPRFANSFEAVNEKGLEYIEQGSDVDVK